MTVNAVSDENLMQGLISGNADAFTVLYARYNRNIFQFVNKYVHSEAMAEDLTQEIFIKIWNCREKLSRVESFKGYLFISARNHTLNSLKAALRIESTMGEVINNFIGQRNTTEERVLDSDYATFLQMELNKLPDRTREIFRLCRQEERTYDEVSQQLGISKSAVKNHMVFSMRVLKSAVEKEFGVSLAVFLSAIFLR